MREKLDKFEKCVLQFKTFLYEKETSFCNIIGQTHDIWLKVPKNKTED